LMFFGEDPPSLSFGLGCCSAGGGGGGGGLLRLKMLIESSGGVSQSIFPDKFSNANNRAA